MIDTIVFLIGLLFILVVPTLLTILICTCIGYYLLAVLHIYTDKTLFTPRVRKYVAFIIGVPVAYVMPRIHDYNPFAFIVSICFLLALSIYGMLRKHITFKEIDTYVHGGQSKGFAEMEPSHAHTGPSHHSHVKSSSPISPKPMKSTHVYNPYGEDDEPQGFAEPSASVSTPTFEEPKKQGGILGMFGFGQSKNEEDTTEGSILDTVENIGEVNMDMAEQIARKYLEVHAQVPRAVKPRSSKKTGNEFHFEFRTDKLHKVTVNKLGNVTDWQKE